MENFLNSILNYKELFGLVLTFIGLIIAWNGVRSWKKQLNGTSKVKLSKSLLSKIYPIRDYYAYARNRMIYHYEYPSQSGIDGDRERMAYVLENRKKSISDKLRAFEDEFYFAYVEWGHSVSPLMKEFRDLYFEYAYAVSFYIDNYGSDGFKQDIDYIREFEIVFNPVGKPDLFKNRLDNTILKFEKFLMPKYKGYIPYLIGKSKFNSVRF